MRKFLWIALGSIAILGIAFLGYRFFQSRPSPESQARSVAEVTMGSLESVVTAQGTLEPKDYVDVGAQVSGLVEKLHAELGDTVKQGDLIAEIDPDVYESQVNASEAELKMLQAQKAEQEALVKQAQLKHQRNKNLIKDKAISQEVLDDAETDMSVAEAKLTSLAAQIEKAQSTLDGHKTNLSYTKIYAPMDGTVVSQSVKEGQTINANQTAPVIVQVANLSVMTVKAQVAEADISKLSTGMSVYFTTLGSSGRKWQGEVRQILPAPETVNDVVLYNVLVDVENEGGQLMTGMTTQMFFVLGRAENVPIVQVSALLKRSSEKDTEQGRAYEVKVISGKGVEDRTVLVGLSDRSKAAVLDGLKAGDRVVLGVSQPAPSAASSSSAPPRMPGMGRL